MFNFAAIGARIKKARKAKGMTQEVLAETVGVSTEYVSRIESGAYHPSLYLIEALAGALGTDEQALLFGTVEPDEDRTLREQIERLSEEQKKAVRLILELIEK